MRALFELTDARFSPGGATSKEVEHLEVCQGESVGIIGPSGCGKSSLLNLVAGLPGPWRGTAHRRFTRLGYVFQDDIFLPWKSAGENVATAARAAGAAKAESRNLARRLFERVGLGDAFDVMPAQLSGGMKQRVNILRALSITPELLLLDEPLSGLDEDTADNVRSTILEEQRANGFAIVQAAHSGADLIENPSRVIDLGGLKSM